MNRDIHAPLAAIIEAFDGLIYVCSPDYRVEFRNRRFIEQTGYEGTGEHCFRVIHDREAICPWCVNQRVFQGETMRWEVQSPKDNRWNHIVNTPIRRQAQQNSGCRSGITGHNLPQCRNKHLVFITLPDRDPEEAPVQACKAVAAPDGYLFFQQRRRQGRRSYVGTH